MTADCESKINEHRVLFMSKLRRFRDLQRVYTPGAIRALLAEEAVCDHDAPSPKAESVRLYLPSELLEAERLHGCQRSIVDMETRLHEAQCSDALVDICTQLQAKSHLISFKNENITSQIQSTRSQSLITQVGVRVVANQHKYTQARCALVQLKGEGHAPHFKKLRTSDLTLPGEQKEDDSAAQEKLARIGSGKQGRAARNGASTNRVLSWIRTAHSPIDMEEQELHESLRVEWSRAKACRSRWVEEVELLREEMCRVLRYLEWQAAFWEDRIRITEARDDVAVPMRQGMAAYAAKQADTWRELAGFYKGQLNMSVGATVDSVLAGLQDDDLTEFFAEAFCLGIYWWRDSTKEENKCGRETQPPHLRKRGLQVARFDLVREAIDVQVVARVVAGGTVSGVHGGGDQGRGGRREWEGGREGDNGGEWSGAERGGTGAKAGKGRSGGGSERGCRQGVGRVNWPGAGSDVASGGGGKAGRSGRGEVNGGHNERNARDRLNTRRGGGNADRWNDGFKGREGAMRVAESDKNGHEGMTIGGRKGKEGEIKEQGEEDVGWNTTSQKAPQTRKQKDDSPPHHLLLRTPTPTQSSLLHLLSSRSTPLSRSRSLSDAEEGSTGIQLGTMSCNYQVLDGPDHKRTAEWQWARNDRESSKIVRGERLVGDTMQREKYWLTSKKAQKKSSCQGSVSKSDHHPEDKKSGRQSGPRQQLASVYQGREALGARRVQLLRWAETENQVERKCRKSPKIAQGFTPKVQIGQPWEWWGFPA
ncbi:hypothetical protein B0H11DRAFT_1912943 [Mycena galericulata]|nr:hypothetical protein B0H11DRAFT_1912943 [Mycena galericulata]